MDLLECYKHIINYPIKALAIIFNVIFIETVLSMDNAIVLSTIIVNMKTEHRRKAIKYGIVGTYIFRCISLTLTKFLIKIWWLKPLSGIYLILTGKKLLNDINSKKKNDYRESSIYKKMKYYLGGFWCDIIIIQIVDIIFSIDNIFATFALSNNLLIIFIGVLISILITRFMLKHMVSIIAQYSFLKRSGIIIIILLGIKLVLTVDVNKLKIINDITNSSMFDICFYVMNVLIFIFPFFCNKKLK